MAITKNELSDLIRDKKLGGDATISGKLHPTIIHKMADTVIGKLIETAMFKDKDSNGYEINGEFISVFKNVKVKYDEDCDEYYSDLPAPLISLKDDRGLVRVSEMKSIDNAFAIVGNGSHDVFAILDAHYLNTKTEVYLQGNQIRYRKLRTGVKEVLVKQVAGISSLDADDPIPVPASMEADLVEMVSALLDEGKVTTQDKYNDNNPNIPTG
jgi:hypothetical protein